VSAKLARTIGLTQATAMVVGTIVGSSIFVQPSEVSKAVPSFGGMLLVWLAAGALTWFGASICAELSSAYPKTGGVYVFLREMFSPAAGFLWGWAMFWSMHSGIIAAIAMVFGRYTATIVPLNDLGIRLVAVGAIAVLSAINYVGVRPGSSVQTGLTIAKIGARVDRDPSIRPVIAGWTRCRRKVCRSVMSRVYQSNRKSPEHKAHLTNPVRAS
jgi:APA family basic amino acid/polyamine antiporter